MDVSFNQFLAVVYGDIFDWPLTRREMQIWAIATKEKGVIPLQRKDKFYFLPGRRKLLALRRRREEVTKAKEKKVERAVAPLEKIPTIRAFFLTGSVAVDNAKRGSDVDLMIVTAPQTLWLTRLVVVLFLKWRGVYRQICPNIFLDTKHLEIKEKNLYTAHEILQAKCLYDKAAVAKRWLNQNNWTKSYLPDAYKFQLANCKSPINPKSKNTKTPDVGYWQLFKACIFLFEILAFVGQYLYMLPKMTNEKVGLHYAFFHPTDLSKKVLKKFSARLRALPL